MAAALGLGTVQFGLPYGIANAGVVPSHHEIGRILDAARAAGVGILDTAAQYGDSEARLGAHDLSRFEIVTKTPALRKLSPAEAEAAVQEAARTSLARLRVPSLKALLVHDAADLIGPSGPSIYHALTAVRRDGYVRGIGVSVYDDAEIEAVLSRFEIDVIQVPVNALDRRLVDNGRIAALAARGIEVHARSVFLQGLLTTREPLPTKFVSHQPVLDRWRASVEAQGMTPIEAAISMVRDSPGVGVVLVGAMTARQLAEVVAAFRRAGRFEAGGRASDSLELIDPRRWT